MLPVSSGSSPTLLSSADIPHDGSVPYQKFERQLLEAAGYTQNSARLQLWDNSYSSYCNLSPAQWVHRQRHLVLRIIEGSTTLQGVADKTAMASKAWEERKSLPRQPANRGCLCLPGCSARLSGS